MIEHTMTPEMKKFFERLVAIKRQVNEAAEKTKDKFLVDISEKLNNLLKNEDVAFKKDKK